MSTISTKEDKEAWHHTVVQRLLPHEAQVGYDPQLLKDTKTQTAGISTAASLINTPKSQFNHTNSELSTYTSRIP